MNHIIYKTTHTNGKYYIGRHSTENIDDGYIGSGLWPRSIKDKSTLSREILETVDTFEELVERETYHLAEHYGKHDCMNMTPHPYGFMSGEDHPMKDPNIAAKISGDNHYSHKHPEKVLRGEEHWMSSNLEARERYIENHPMKTPENREKASIRRTERNYTHNPATISSVNGTHQWQNGNSPNYGGKLNKKLIAEGKHNWQGPEHNRKMIAEGKHNWVGPDANKKMLLEGKHPSQMKKTCEHCGKETSVGMYKRWHGDNCKLNK